VTILLELITRCVRSIRPFELSAILTSKKLLTDTPNNTQESTWGHI
jgi:hypothetical protein